MADSIARIYLAGPITGLNYEGATNWREYVKKKLPPHVMGLSPMRGKDYLLNVTEIGDHYDDRVLSTEAAIVARDEFDVARCDMVLVNFLGADRVSIGTVAEMGLARAYRKPIVVCMERDNVHQHAFVRRFAGWITEDLDEAIMVVCSVFYDDVRPKAKE